MVVKKYRKRPVVIEALQWTGVCPEMEEFMGAVRVGPNHVLLIDTLEGTMIGNIGDWIIKGVGGEFYPCKPDIFKETYTEVE